MTGYQFTSERSRGTTSWVEERLDRAMATQPWISLFSHTIVYTLEAAESDHLPIFLDPFCQRNKSRQRRFCFENIWLNEAGCREVIQSSWDGSERRLI